MSEKTNELVDIEKFPQLSRKALIGWMDSQTKQLLPAEKEQFIAIAQRFHLDPFKREIYAIPYGKGDNRSLSIITGYEVYLKRAERSNMWDGMKSGFDGKLIRKMVEVDQWDNFKKKYVKKQKEVWRACPEKGAVFWCEVYRKDMKYPVREEIDFDEYTQDNQMWENKPKTMGKKVAKAQAFRAAFPDELGGMPYTRDELPDKMTGFDPEMEINQNEERPFKTQKQSDSISKEHAFKNSKTKAEKAEEAEIVETVKEQEDKSREIKPLDEPSSKDSEKSEAKGSEGISRNDTSLGNHLLHEELRLGLLSCESVEEIVKTAKNFQKENAVIIKEHDDLRALLEAQDAFIKDPKLEEFCSTKDGILYLRDLTQIF